MGMGGVRMIKIVIYDIEDWKLVKKIIRFEEEE
jgi:hypothetical protein